MFDTNTAPGVLPHARAFKSLFATAPLAVPVYDDRPTATHDGRAWDAKIGMLVHQVIADVASSVQAIGLDAAGDLLSETVGRLVTSNELGSLTRARTRTIGMANRYLRDFLPGPSAVLLGTEYRTGNGRADLAWDLPGVGVWFDEIKTWRHAAVGLDTDTWEQVHRYMDAGLGRFGSRFVGVRVLTLSHPGACEVVTAIGTREPLVGSDLDPAVLSLGRAA